MHTCITNYYKAKKESTRLYQVVKDKIEPWLSTTCNPFGDNFLSEQHFVRYLVTD